MRNTIGTRLEYWKVGFGLATLVLLCVGTAVAQTTYTVTDLGTLGGTFSVALTINNQGSIDGYSTLPGDTAVHAFVWRKGLMTDLGHWEGRTALRKLGLNESGKVPGAAESSTPDPNGEDFCGTGTHLICRAFLWRNGVMTDLGTLGGNNSVGLGVNNRGQVVGHAENAATDPTCTAPQLLHFEPFLSEKGGMQELPPFPGDPDGEAVSINDNGQAVGGTGNCIVPFHAVLWQDGVVSDLGSPRRHNRRGTPCQ
jgi:probable HAF family extracellular repeat protein